MKLRAALLSVFGFTLLASVATAVEPTPAANPPAANALATPAAPAVPWQANMSPAETSTCGTFSLPKASERSPAAQPLTSLGQCGACSFGICKGAGVNGGCGGLNKCYIYGTCTDNSPQCLCSYGEI